MLIDEVDRYVALRRSLGYKLRNQAPRLQGFARFAAERGETHVRAATAIAWATAASTRYARQCRLTDVVLFARFIRAEDPEHEIPPENLFKAPVSRPAPYIFTADEIARILELAGELRPQKPNPMRRQIYVTLFGLIASTGLRVSEAINLKLSDVLPGGILHIRETKFSKRRLVPLHKTVMEALERYLDVRRPFPAADDHLFLSVEKKVMDYGAVLATFRSILRRANIAPERTRRPRIHDLRHSFATRVLEQCATERGAVARQFVALSTYLGHADAKHTFWYLQATPELMADMSAAAEAIMAEAAP